MVILFSLYGICYGFESTSIQFPQARFQSVNTLTIGTNHQYNITPVGAQDMCGSQTNYSPRRANGIGHGDGNNPNDPFATPIGDTPWPLMLLIIGFYIIRKKWKRMKSSTFYKLFTFSVYNI